MKVESAWDQWTMSFGDKNHGRADRQALPEQHTQFSDVPSVGCQRLIPDWLQWRCRLLLNEGVLRSVLCMHVGQRRAR